MLALQPLQQGVQWGPGGQVAPKPAIRLLTESPNQVQFMVLYLPVSSNLTAHQEAT